MGIWYILQQQGGQCGGREVTKAESGRTRAKKRPDHVRDLQTMVKGSDFTPRWMVWGKPYCDLHVKIPFWLPCEEQSLGDMNEYKEMG